MKDKAYLVSSVLYALVKQLIVLECNGRRSMSGQLAAKTARHTSCMSHSTHSTCMHYFKLQDLSLAVLLMGNSTLDTSMNAWHRGLT